MPSRSTLIALLALFLAVGGTATAAKRLIDGRTIKNRSVTTQKLTKSAVKSLRRAALAPVTGARIIDGTVTGADLAPRSVGNDQVVDRSLTGGKLVADTVSATELGVGAAGEEEVGSDAVGNSEIKGNAISRNQLRASILRVGIVTGTLGTIAPGACAAQTLTPPASYAIPTGAFANTTILVGAPADLPDGLVVSGRSPDGTALRVQACNLSASGVTLGELAFPFTAFGT